MEMIEKLKSTLHGSGPKRERSSLNGISPLDIMREAGVSRSSVYNWADGKPSYIRDRITVAVQKLTIMLDKLHKIAKGEFETMDFDCDNLTVTISVDGFDDTDVLQVCQDDVLSVAMAFNLIDTYLDPSYGGGHFYAEIDARIIAFPFWFEGLDGIDKKRLFSGAISTRIELALKNIVRESTPQKV